MNFFLKFFNQLMVHDKQLAPIYFCGRKILQINFLNIFRLFRYIIIKNKFEKIKIIF
jgi:hypothetical protein